MLNQFTHTGRLLAASVAALLMGACATPAPPAEEPAAPVPAIAVNVPAPAAPAPAPAGAPAPSAAQLALLRDWETQQTRLNNVAAPLLIKNTALCKRQARELAGFTAKTQYSYSKDMIGAAQAAFGLGEQLQVMSVMPGSGAESSGLLVGDRLVSAQDRPVPRGPNAERDAAAVFGAAMQGRSSLSLKIVRAGAPMTIEVPLTRACAFGIELGNADYVNSYTDGQQVMVTRGMLAYVKSDQELANVLAKEISHAILTPPPRPAWRAMIASLRMFSSADPGGSRDALRAALKPYSPVLDSTADKLSLYMLAAGGYEIDDTLEFWKRLATRYPATDRDSHTALHPASAYRFSVMTAVVRVVKSKMVRDLPLVP
ncbi:MAG: M48 family metalloprotease [Janthinobacterium lividum]